MPTYLYECESEGRFEIYQPITSQTLTVCPDCQSPVKKIFTTVMLGAGTGDTRKGSKRDAEFSRKFEAGLEKDRPAYKSMKDQGLKPAKMVGAHRLMTESKHQLEIETGRKIPATVKEIDDIIDVFEESNPGKSLLKIPRNKVPIKVAS